MASCSYRCFFRFFSLNMNLQYIGGFIELKLLACDISTVNQDKSLLQGCHVPVGQGQGSGSEI